MRSWGVLVGVLVVSAACGSESSSPSSSGGDAVTVTVFAASSLTDAFEEIGERFESDNPAATIRFNFLASSDLAAQIEEGAPASVFASADEANMTRVGDAGVLASDPVVFARNQLEIIVTAGNPQNVSGLEDLEDSSLVISLCNAECPAGKYAGEAFENAAVEVDADSLETEVKAVITRVSLGEADAGIVYKTDIDAAGEKVEGVEIPESDNVIATYPIAALEGSPSEARDFVDLVTSDPGQGILRGFGFLPR
ncbi:MAG: molybdate ABC transporter substrate-binding protein [Actinobacteria bacterium]|nr:molybdate ABC transporter substrate-binding protein [Actinomycetota bacterium]